MDLDHQILDPVEGDGARVRFLEADLVIEEAVEGACYLGTVLEFQLDPGPPAKAGDHRGDFASWDHPANLADRRAGRQLPQFAE